MMERDNFTYKGNNDALKKVLMKEGFLGFYNGYGAAAIGILIYHGCSFFIFTKQKERIKKQNRAVANKWYVDLSLGALSSAGQFVAYPFDVLRRRMMGQYLLLQKKEIESRTSYLQLIKDIFQK